MGYALLWTECLAVGLLLVATSLAFLARTKLPRWGLCCIVVGVMLVPLSLFGTLLGGVAGLQWGYGIVTGLFVPLLALFVIYLVGALGLILRGLRRRHEKAAAASWVLGKCSVALLVGLILVPMTYWNLDLAVSQRLAMVRVEAGALALAAAPPKLSEEDNAALVYGRVFESWGEDRQRPQVWEDAIDATNATPVGSQSESDEQEENVKFNFGSRKLAGFLSEHAAELKLLRQGAALPSCRFDRDFGRPSLDMMLPELQHLRTAARTLSVEAHYLATKGETAKALENVQAMFNMAQHTASEPFLVSVLVGIAIDGMAINTLQAVSPTGKLNSDEVVALEIPVGITYQDRIAKSFRMEEAMALWLFSELDSQRDWVKTISLANLDGDGSAVFPGFASLYRVFLLGQDMHYYREMIGSFENLGGQPYHKAKQYWEERDKSLSEQRGGLLTSMLLPALSTCVKASVRGDAQHRTAQVAWAMHRYRAEHGDFPEKLADLTPGTLTMLPLDPFDGKPIRMKRTPDGWVVYSIGPDMTDDDGTPMDLQNKQGDLTFSYHAGE